MSYDKTKKTIAFEKAGQTLVVVHSALPPSAHEWMVMLDVLEAGGFDSVLIDSVGGVPSLKQLRLLASKSFPPLRVALVSSATASIAALAAFNLMQNRFSIKGFKSHALNSALDYLELSEDAKRKVEGLRLRASFF